MQQNIPTLMTVITAVVKATVVSCGALVCVYVRARARFTILYSKLLWQFL
jgi:hypothetical protein